MTEPIKVDLRRLFSSNSSMSRSVRPAPGGRLILCVASCSSHSHLGARQTLSIGAVGCVRRSARAAAAPFAGVGLGLGAEALHTYGEATIGTHPLTPADHSKQGSAGLASVSEAQPQRAYR